MKLEKDPFKEEKELAQKFIEENNNNCELNDFMFNIRQASYLKHSDRWSLVFDFIVEFFPTEKRVITGLTYLLES